MAQYDQQQPIDIKKLRPLIIGGVVVVFFLLFGSKMTVTIDSGEAGVLFRTFDGGVDIEQTYGEGFHLMAPWNKMYIYEVRQQAASEKMSVLSSNGLEITLDVTLWFEPKYSQLGLLHQEKGTDYSLRVVKPAIGAATKSVIGRYTPEEIYSTKRDKSTTNVPDGYEEDEPGRPKTKYSTYKTQKDKFGRDPLGQKSIKDPVDLSVSDTNNVSTFQENQFARHKDVLKSLRKKRPNLLTENGNLLDEKNILGLD